MPRRSRTWRGIARWYASRKAYDLFGSRSGLDFRALRVDGQIVQARAHSYEEAAMALRFIGVDPASPNNGSPTIWLDETDQSIVIQGWKVTDDDTISEITATKPIPAHETVIRLPARM